MSEEIPAGVKSFLAKTKNELLFSGVKIDLSEDSHVFFPPAYDIPVNGYFITEPLLLACGTGKSLDQWFPIYVHEFNHFRQWKEQDPEYLAGFIDGREAFEYIDDIVEGRVTATKEEFWNYVNRARNLEANCERRSHAMIIEFELPIDKDRYAQQANSYIHFYNYIGLNRTWYTPGKEPYNIEEVWSKFNTTIDTDPAPVNWSYMSLFDEYCMP